MAHADYDCCAVCDSKLCYNPMDPRTKKSICSSCLRRLHEHDVWVYTPQELIDWIRRTDKETVARTLYDVGFQFCFYTNEVDLALREKGIKPNKEGYIDYKHKDDDEILHQIDDLIKKLRSQSSLRKVREILENQSWARAIREA